jgi:uncharacterized protein YkwD
VSRKTNKAFLASLAVFLVAWPAQAAASPESRMLGAIDGVRRAHGLPALRDSGALNHSAENWSQAMLSNGRFGHGSRISAPGNWKNLGENLSLSFGWRANPGGVLRGWMSSPAHRSVILNSSYRYAGVGAARGRFRGRKATAWTLHVGRPANGRR